MANRDIHLAAASISGCSREFFERYGFVEDMFRECENCSPTLYHATYRGSAHVMNEEFWNSLVSHLHSDSEFNGLLEYEDTVEASHGVADLVYPVSVVPALKTQPCPALIHKACDVHISIKLDNLGKETVDWLSALHIASFKKMRDDGFHRIFSATFDSLDTGKRFYDFVRQHAPRSHKATFKAKLERVVHALRIPRNAVTLPLTFTYQLEEWAESIVPPQNMTKKAPSQFGARAVSAITRGESSNKPV